MKIHNRIWRESSAGYLNSSFVGRQKFKPMHEAAATQQDNQRVVLKWFNTSSTSKCARNTRSKIAADVLGLLFFCCSTTRYLIFFFVNYLFFCCCCSCNIIICLLISGEKEGERGSSEAIWFIFIWLLISFSIRCGSFHLQFMSPYGDAHLAHAKGADRTHTHTHIQRKCPFISSTCSRPSCGVCIVRKRSFTS